MRLLKSKTKRTIKDETLIPLQFNLRVVRPPKGYRFHMSEKYDNDLTSCDEAFEDHDMERGKLAIMSKVDFIYKCCLWTLEDPPIRVRPIWCKWIFRRKREPDEKVETFKARFVAKSYTHRKKSSLVMRLAF